MSRDKIHWKNPESKIPKYSCQGAVEPRDEYITEDITKVTCKNCLRKLIKYADIFEDKREIKLLHGLLKSKNEKIKILRKKVLFLREIFFICLAFFFVIFVSKLLEML